MKNIIERIVGGGAKIASYLPKAVSTRLLVLAIGLGLVSTGWAVYSPGDTVTWSNADGLTASDVVNANHCSWALNIPASSDLPEGSVVSITNVKLASVNQTRTSNSSETDKLNDPHSIAIGATRSSECSFITSSTLAGKYIDSYDFTSGCEVTVGHNYPANGANYYTSMTGCGVTFLHSNGNRWSGGNRMDCTVGGTTSGIISNGSLYPIYEITATVVSVPSLPVKFDYDVAANSVSAYSDNWPSSIANDCSDYQRIGSNGSSIIYDLKGGAGYASMAAKTSAFSFALYADVYRMSTTAKSVIAVFGTNASDTNKLILYRDGANLKLGYFDGSWNVVSGTSVASVTAPTDAAFHLITAVCDPTNGSLALYVDDGTDEGCSDSVTPDPTVTVALSANFQLGSVHGGGLGGDFERGDGCGLERMQGFDIALSSSQVGTLAEDFLSRADNTITADIDYSGNKTLLVYSATPGAGVNKFLGVTTGTLTIPEGSTVSVPHVRVLNSSASTTATMNIAGELQVTSTSTAKNVWSERGNYKGILFGHWAGTCTYNITGSLIGENAYLETVYTAGSQTIDINGGLLKVKGLYANKNNSSILLRGGGTLEVAEIPSDGSVITKNFGAGTFKVTSSQTETRAINFNAGEGDYTTLDPVANTLTLNASAVTGAGAINVAPSNGGKVTFASLTDAYSGNIKVSSGSAEIRGASGYTGSIEANAPLTITNDAPATLAVLSGTADITKIGEGTLTITGTGTATGKMIVNSGSKLVLSGPEAKVGTGMFELKNASASLDIVPGAGNTITLAPAFIVNSSVGGSSINVGPGEFVVASTGPSGYGHFGQSDINILNGGTMRLTKASLFGNNMYTTVTVNNGGLLAIDAFQEMTRNLTLAGGTVTLANADPAFVYKNNAGRPINVTEDSEIRAVGNESVANPTIQMESAGITFNVSSGKTLSLNACIAEGVTAARQGKGITKNGAGTLALNGANGSGYNYTGATTVSAGTLLINATQSGSAYSLAAGTTLKFGTGANLSVPSLTLPASGTVTVDVSDLNLSGSGTTLMTFTSAPSADDVAAKMTVSGAVLKLEGLALKAYPIAAVVEANGTAHYCDNLSAAMSAVMITYSSTYDHFEIFSSIGETVYLDSMWLSSGAFKLKCLNDAAVTVQAASAEYTAQAGAPDENGIVTYTGGNAATTYTWNWSSGMATWNRPSNWTYGTGTAATRAPVSGDTVVFNDGAAVTLGANAECAAMTVNGAVAISGDYGLNVSGNVTGGTGTPVLSISSADLNLSALSSVSGVSLVLADSTATVLATTGATLAAVPTTTVEDSYVKTTANVGATTYSVAAKTVVTVSVGLNVSLTINGSAVADGDTLKFAPGDTFTYVATPAANYTANVAVTGGTDNDGTVTVGEAAIAVAATATLDTYTITIPAVANTTVSVSYTSGGVSQTATAAGAISVDYGTSLTATWTAVSGYQITANAEQTINPVVETQTLTPPTVEAMSQEATVSNVSFSPSANGKATVTATITGPATTATLNYGGSPYYANVVNGSVTFENVSVGQTSDSYFAPTEYSLTTDAGQTTGQTSGLVDGTSWINENATTHVGGAWTNDVSYVNNKATIKDNRFQAASAAPTAAGGLVVLTMNVNFPTFSDAMVDGDAQGAITLREVGNTPTFSVLTTNGTEKVWTDVTGVTANTNIDYVITLTFNYAANKYTAAVGGTTLSAAGGVSEFDILRTASSVQNIDFVGEGVLEYLKGDVAAEGAMVEDAQHNKYATVDAAIAAYNADKTIGLLTMLHPGSVPSGWKVVNGIISKIIKGWKLIAY